MNEIGKKMYERRKELGLTLEEVGEAVGVGKSTVRKWENGMIKNMGRDKIAALARVLQVDPVMFVPVETNRISYAIDSIPELVPDDKTEEELRALIKIWKVSTPEKRKFIMRVIKAMTEEED